MVYLLKDKLLINSGNISFCILIVPCINTYVSLQPPTLNRYLDPSMHHTSIRCSEVTSLSTQNLHQSLISRPSRFRCFLNLEQYFCLPQGQGTFCLPQRWTVLENVSLLSAEEPGGVHGLEIKRLMSALGAFLFRYGSVSDTHKSLNIDLIKK